MDVKNITTELKKAPLDPKAGIKLVKLTGDKNISVFAAEIAPRTELNPHIHEHGNETYQILYGSGKMKIGQRKNNSVLWDEIFNVETGDCYSVNEGQVHQIINESDSLLLVVFSCPEAHLGDDRTFI